MKKILLIAITLINTAIYAQNTETKEVSTIEKDSVKYSEPKWVGDAVYIDKNNKSIELENSKAYAKVAAGASLYIVGVGSVTYKYIVKGNKSPVRIKSNNNLTFIVNAGSNDVNPKSVFKIVKLVTKKKNKRYFISASSGTFTGTKSGDLDFVSFRAEKLGENSYIINC